MRIMAQRILKPEAGLWALVFSAVEYPHSTNVKGDAVGHWKEKTILSYCYFASKKKKRKLSFTLRYYTDLLLSQAYVRMVTCHVGEGTAHWGSVIILRCRRDDKWASPSSLCFQHFMKYYSLEASREEKFGITIYSFN